MSRVVSGLVAAIGLSAWLVIATGENTRVEGTYTAEFRFDGVQHAGTLDVGPGSDRGLRGRLTLHSPSAIAGSVTGYVTSTDLTFDLTYQRSADDCRGSGRGSGNIAERGKHVTGKITIVDCASKPRSGTFVWSRR